MAKKNLFIFNDGGFITNFLERTFAFEMVKVKECSGVYGWNGDIFSFCRRLVYNEYRTVPHNYNYFYIPDDSEEYKEIKTAILEYLKTKKTNEDVEKLKYKIVFILDSLAYKKIDAEQWNKFIKYAKNIEPEEYTAIIEALKSKNNNIVTEYVFEWINNKNIIVKIFYSEENRATVTINYDDNYYKSFEIPNLETMRRLINYAMSRAKSYRKIKEMNAIIKEA